MFVVKNKDLAKQVVAQLKAKLLEFGYEISHLKCLDLLARMYGHANWKEMEDVGKRAAFSSLDEDAPETEVIERRQIQIAALREFGIKEAVLAKILDDVRPTGRRTQADPFKIDDEQTETLIKVAREASNEGKYAVAAGLLTHAIAHGPRRVRLAVVEELDRLSNHDTTACYTLGIAYLIGDAPGGKDVATARKYFERCLAFHAGDEPSVNSYCALGDIVGGLHGGSKDIEAALQFYMTAALSGKSGDGAFNAGLQYEKRRQSEIAAAFYRLGIVQMHAGCMTNLGNMIARREVPGSLKEISTLFEAASRLGDAKATNSLRNIEALAYRMTMPPELDELFEGMQPPEMFIRIMPIKTWLKVLTRHGWELSDIRTALTDEMDVFASTRLPDGRDINIHACLGMRVAGGEEDSGTELFHRRFGQANGVVIYNKAKPIAEGASPDVVHLCIGRLHMDGEWSDVFLEPGGVSAAIEQRRAIKINPGLDRSFVFRCGAAEAVASDLEDATLRAIDKWAIDY
jgi:TPR repeat protein